MTKQEIREEIKIIHFPGLPPERLPDLLVDKLILKAYDRAITMGHVYRKSVDIALVSGSYDLSDIADFYEPSYYEYDGDKLRKMEFENISSVPIVYSSSLVYYYQKDRTLYVINGATETITVTYWAYPPAPTSDTAIMLVLDDQFSGVLVSRVCWQIAQGLNPKGTAGYIASYNEEFKIMKQYYIKKFSPGSGYTIPMDY